MKEATKNTTCEQQAGNLPGDKKESGQMTNEKYKLIDEMRHAIFTLSELDDKIVIDDMLKLSVNIQKLVSQLYQKQFPRFLP